MGTDFTSRKTLTRCERRPGLALESLESRELMAVGTLVQFTGPNLFRELRGSANGVQNTSAIINIMDTALERQATGGVLTALQGGTYTPAQFQTSITNLVQNYETNVDSQLLPRFTDTDAILKGQAQALLQEVNALTVQQSNQLITLELYRNESVAAVASITHGPLYPLNTPAVGYAEATQILENQLNLLPATFTTTNSPNLTLAEVQTISAADTAAYSSAINTALYTDPKIAKQVNTEVGNYNSKVTAITSTGSTTPAQQLSAAITALDDYLLDTNGLFGPKGRLRS